MDIKEKNARIIFEMKDVNRQVVMLVLDKIEKDGKIIAGIIARMYCWNVVYIDTLWVDSKL